ncbi:hypothetical protein D3C73_1489060 [compost metagenome]
MIQALLQNEGGKRPGTSRTRRLASQRVIRPSISTSISREGQMLSPIQSTKASRAPIRVDSTSSLPACLALIEVLCCASATVFITAGM